MLLFKKKRINIELCFSNFSFVHSNVAHQSFEKQYYFLRILVSSLNTKEINNVRV
jgi:hypothetical protein